jgi:hypothetical protein
MARRTIQTVGKAKLPAESDPAKPTGEPVRLP